jgi:cell division protein FtsI (penicillin-binding protein 3)
MHDTAFYRLLDSLSQGLAEIFPKKNRLEWKRDLINAKRSKPVKRYWLLHKEVSFGTYERVRDLPMMGLQRDTKHLGALIAVQSNRRVLPYGNLAARTIGYIHQGRPRVGLEAGLDSVLSGEPGMALRQRMGGGVWKPVGQDFQREPRNGRPVVTTLDIRLQEIAHQALTKTMVAQGAMKGCAILMEIQTGKIRVMVNMVRQSQSHGDSGKVGEYDQVAYGIGVEPGSVFKLVALTAGLSDGFWTLEDSIAMNDYIFKNGPFVLEDEHKYGSWMKVEEIFAKSSNVGVARLLHRHYGKRPEAFFAKLRDFGLDQSMNLPILSDPKPKFRTTALRDYSPTDLYSTGIGYSMLITPLQLLTFYNAIVNEGIRVEPSLIQEIQGEPTSQTSVQWGGFGSWFKETGVGVAESFPGSGVGHVTGRRILDRNKAMAARRMMRRVAIDGTVKEQMKGLTFGVGGKTGTARLRDGSGKTMHDRHRAMFIGYFPEPNPRYSCLVMLEDPGGGLYYASQIAAPVFRDIAEQTMAIKEFRQIAGGATTLSNGSLQRQSKDPGNFWDQVQGMKVNDLLGMDAAAAVWALESKGYRVSLQGIGKVRQCMGLGESDLLEHGGIPVAKPGQRVMLLLGT